MNNIFMSGVALASLLALICMQIKFIQERKWFHEILSGKDDLIDRYNVLAKKQNQKIKELENKVVELSS